MERVTLYQKDSSKRLRIWWIEVKKNEDDIWCIYVSYGLLHGAIISAITPIERGTNIGRENEKTAYEQAKFDAEREITLKIRSGYVTDLSNVREKHETPTIPKPMKGEVYHPDGYNGGLTLLKSKYAGKEVYVQLKFDGWRIRIVVKRDGCTFYTSSGKITLSFPQIEEVIMKKYFLLADNRIISEDAELVLDGEIYNHELGYNAVASATATTVHITPEKQKLRDQMQFYIFDCVMYGFYPKRHEFCRFFQDYKNIIAVDNYVIIANDKEIKQIFEAALKDGYEGLIIRAIDQTYNHTKNRKNFLKYKPLIDDEFIIKGFKKSITGETLGSFICATSEGLEFRADLKGDLGTDKFKQEVWNNQEKFIGKLLTVEFLEYTPDKVPRNGKGLKIREQEDIS